MCVRHVLLGVAITRAISLMPLAHQVLCAVVKSISKCGFFEIRGIAGDIGIWYIRSMSYKNAGICEYVYIYIYMRISTCITYMHVPFQGL